MKTTTHYFNGVTATVFQMEAGEKIARHRHSNEHTTSVIAGRSEVEIWGDHDAASIRLQMNPGQPDYVLPAGRDHEVRALETPTIVIHMQAGTAGHGAGGAQGGVMLHDGTVVPHGS